jgi:hypothetical protein
VVLHALVRRPEPIEWDESRDGAAGKAAAEEEVTSGLTAH